mmetsp:Transcript_20558/g.38665  ORF Transcript_20558/g.38665 Transcript_20558/m.38665 type:complete len:99 (-) Transcript_20558:510-806(-)
MEWPRVVRYMATEDIAQPALQMVLLVLVPSGSFAQRESHCLYAAQEQPLLVMLKMAPAGREAVVSLPDQLAGGGEGRTPEGRELSGGCTEPLKTPPGM